MKPYQPFVEMTPAERRKSSKQAERKLDRFLKSKAGRKGLRDYRFKTEREWRRIWKAAERFYGARNLRSRQHILLPSVVLTSLATPGNPHTVGIPRLCGGQYILAPKEPARKFLESHGCSLRNQQKRRFFMDSPIPTFLPTESFSELIKRRTAPLDSIFDWHLNFPDYGSFLNHLRQKGTKGTPSTSQSSTPSSLTKDSSTPTT